MFKCCVNVVSKYDRYTKSDCKLTRNSGTVVLSTVKGCIDTAEKSSSQFQIRLLEDDSSEISTSPC
jgi:hypothetical protein